MGCDNEGWGLSKRAIYRKNSRQWAVNIGPIFIPGDDTGVMNIIVKMRDGQRVTGDGRHVGANNDSPLHDHEIFIPGGGNPRHDGPIFRGGTNHAPSARYRQGIFMDGGGENPLS